MTKKVGLTGQTILALIPSFITQLIAFARINKLKVGGLMILGLFGVSIGLQMVLPFPYGLISVIVISIAIPVKYVRKWTKEYNNNLNEIQENIPTSDFESTEDLKKEQNNNSLKILKERLAKGEITREEYDELKKNFE